MKKILVPVDFSDKSDFALETAVNIADKLGSELLLLHVIEGVTSRTFSVQGEMNFSSSEEQIFTFKLIEKAKGQIEERINDAAYENAKMKYEIQVGSPYNGIKKIITEQDVDLIVMGTAGANNLEEYLVGSTTEKVVRYSKSPVLTVHKKLTKFDYKDIVLATGLKEKEKSFIKIVSKLQEVYDSKIHLVRINTPNNFERDKDSYSALTEFAEGAGLKNYTINVFNDVTEEEGIIYFADYIKADLISLATHGRTGFAHLLSGSIAEDVVNYANRPVLTCVISK